MGLFLDFFPLIAFLIALKLFDIYAATFALMVASAAQVIGVFAWKRKVERLHLVTLALALVLGGVTLWLHDARFIKWKPTIAFWLFGSVILGRQWFGKRSSIKALMLKASPEISGVPDTVWRRIDHVWGATLLVAGGANLVIAYSMSDKLWGTFKVFGTLGLNLALVVYTVFEVQKHQAAERPPLADPVEPTGDDRRL